MENMKPGNLEDIVIIASTAVFIVTTFLQMNISPVLGYFVSGAVIGAHGLGLVHAHGMMEAFAEFGIVFLLFLIGLELTFERLVAMRLHVFGFGSLQVIITAISIAVICSTFGGMEIKAAAIIGGGLALSSTAIVLQVLKEKNKDTNQVGRLSIAILLLQDFAVVPLLVFVQMAHVPSNDAFLVNLMNAILKAAIALIAIFVTGRLLLRPVFNSIAGTRSKELFVATTLLIILLAAYLTESFELSMELGAFVAGLLVAETEYRHQVEEVVLPFKGLLLGLFFMTVGMSIDLHLLVNEFTNVLSVACALILLKTFVIVALCFIFKFKLGSALNAGLLLSQGGEFAFILFGMEEARAILGETESQILMMVVTVTMAMTPLLYNLGEKLASRIDGEDDSFIPKEEDFKDLDQHIIIGGFGRVGKMVAELLSLKHINCVSVDTNRARVEKENNKGHSIYLGDIGRLNTLKSLSVSRCKAIIITVRNEATMHRAVKVIKSNFPEVIVVARVYEAKKAILCKEMGVDKIVSEAQETALKLSCSTLSALGLNDSSVRSIQHNFEEHITNSSNN